MKSARVVAEALAELCSLLMSRQEKIDSIERVLNEYADAKLDELVKLAVMTDHAHMNYSSFLQSVHALKSPAPQT
jgi:REP element-mobilizing transposase RayT